MRKLQKQLAAALLVLAAGLFYPAIPQAASPNYDAQVEALYAKRAALDNELAKSTPDPRKIESLSKEIGELQGKILASDTARTRSSGQGDYPDARYYRGHGHYGHHHGGHGCW